MFKDELNLLGNLFDDITGTTQREKIKRQQDLIRMQNDQILRRLEEIKKENQ